MGFNTKSIENIGAVLGIFFSLHIYLFLYEFQGNDSRKKTEKKMPQEIDKRQIEIKTNNEVCYWNSNECSADASVIVLAVKKYLAAFAQIGHKNMKTSKFVRTKNQCALQITAVIKIYT